MTQKDLPRKGEPEQEKPLRRELLTGSKLTRSGRKKVVAVEAPKRQIGGQTGRDRKGRG